MTPASDQPAPWSPNGAPFFWIPKEAWDRIDQSLERGPAATAKHVYSTLCLLANREDSPTFQLPINYIATVASLERRTVERRLCDLVTIGLVTVDHEIPQGASRPSGPSRYTLTTLSHTPTTLSRTRATARGPQPVILPREQENRRTTPLPPEGGELKLPIPAELDTPAFREAWETWVKFRLGYKSKPRKPEIMFKAQLARLAKHPESAVDVLEQSICGGWQGLFDIKNQSAPAKKRRDQPI